MQDPKASEPYGEAAGRSPAERHPEGVALTSGIPPIRSSPEAKMDDPVQPEPSLADQAKQKLTGTIEGQKAAAADLVEHLAETVHRSGEQFKGQQDWIASAIERGAAELDTLASSLREKNVGDLMSQAQSFARRQPALFMGATLALGFAIARVGKVVAGDLSRDDLPTMPEVGHGH